MTLKEYLSTLANKFRDKLDTTEKISAQDFVDKVDEVYNIGQESILEQSTSIKKEVSDTAIITLTNPIEVPHNITIHLFNENVTDFSKIQLYKIGTNLWGGELEYGSFSTTTGETPVVTSPNTRVRSKDFVYLPKGTYRIQTVSGLKFVVYVYDRDGVYKKDESLINWSTNNSLEFSIEENRKIKFGICFADGGTIIPDNVDWIMLNYSTITTEYIPYSQQPIEVKTNGEVILLVDTKEDLSLVVKPEDTTISLVYNHTKSPLDEFWDSFQNCGKRVNYQYSFAGQGWGKSTLKPKYNIKPTGSAGYMFHLSGRSLDPVRMKDIEQECGIIFDFSAATALTEAFANCCFSQINELDLTALDNSQISSLFYHGYYPTHLLEEIDGLIFAEDKPITSSIFGYCDTLKHVIFKGSFAGKLNLKWSKKLDKESILSIMTTLSDTYTNGTATISLTAVKNAFETSEGAADGNTSEEWTVLVAAKPNWAITLADA